MPQVVAAYKPRPLAGIWATAPFLHNGSVPTIYDLLSPVADRPKTFRVGSREYDTEKLGLKQPRRRASGSSTRRRRATTTPATSSTAGYKPWKEGDPPAQGLIGPLLSHEDRLAIIEHLKVRNDDVDGPQEPHYPSSARCNPLKRADEKTRYVR